VGRKAEVGSKCGNEMGGCSRVAAMEPPLSTAARAVLGSEVVSGILGILLRFHKAGLGFLLLLLQLFPTKKRLR
jgi:hypothetical protein